MKEIFEFEHVQNGAWTVWSGRVRLGILLKQGSGRWEAYTDDGRMVISDDDRRALLFRSREQAAKVLAELSK